MQSPLSSCVLIVCSTRADLMSQIFTCPAPQHVAQQRPPAASAGCRPVSSVNDGMAVLKVYQGYSEYGVWVRVAGRPVYDVDARR